MKNVVTLTIALSALCLLALTVEIPQAANSGEQLFQQHCSACHPSGGNLINPKKTLHKADLDSNKIVTSEVVIDKMRNPGPGMSKFDTTVLSDSDAKTIAEYVLTAF